MITYQSCLRCNWSRGHNVVQVVMVPVRVSQVVTGPYELDPNTLLVNAFLNIVEQVMDHFVYTR